MKQIKQIIVGILLSVVSFYLLEQPVQASQLNFSVTTIPAESQIDQENTYFDLVLPKGKSEKIEVELKNSTENEVEIGIAVNSTTTNSNVSVEYGENDLEKDESLDHDISDYVNYPDTVVLEPESSKVVSFEVTMPDELFDGVMAGGITFEEILPENSEIGDGEGLSIQNEYSYVVALLIRQNLNSVTPNLNLKKVKADQINARNVISALLQNDQKTYINQVVISTQITKQGSSDVLYQEEKTSLQIAPNSHFYFPTALNGNNLEAGDYHLAVEVYGDPSDDGEYIYKTEGEKLSFAYYWEFEKDFTIEKNIAKDLNKKDVSLKKDTSSFYPIVIGILVLMVIILAILLVRNRKSSAKNK